MSDDDFFIPTGEELDRGEIARKPHKRGLFTRMRERRAARRVELEVPESIGTRRKLRSPGEPLANELVDGAGSTGRVVRSIDASEGVAKRELIIPPELREKYGLDQ